ncbi:MAG: membrane protein insertase YidC, partial [Alphaproteobacteria bacterium]|nr:membrane protein insertase YidC [Alphaproteobacteria bacterium]
MNDQKNLILAVALSIGIFFTWDHFFGVKPQTVQTQTQVVESAPLSEKTVPIAAPVENMIVDRPLALTDERIAIETDKIKGSIRLKGALLDDVTLLNHRTSVDKDSDPIYILSPKNTKDAYFVDFNVLCADAAEQPTADTVWQVLDHRTLTPETPVTLFWVSPKGVRFERRFEIDADYLVTVFNKVTNHSDAALCVQHQGMIQRQKPKTEGFFILHEGAIGFIDNHLVEREYDKIAEKTKEDIKSSGGWVGFTDKYWLVAMIPNQKAEKTFSFKGNTENGFSTAIASEQKSLQPGEGLEQSVHVFVGPKKLKLLDAYEGKLGVNKLDLAIDFGWFYFLTKPLFQFLDLVHGFVGNFGIAILILTLLSKILLFPLANKSFYSMARMKALAPKMDQIKARFKDDPVKLQQEIMNLYKSERVNPLSGCLPMLVQAPIFFCLYKVLFISIEMRHAPFIGWIQDLSAPDPTT